MREELLQKFYSLQKRKRLMCSRSTKIREIELKRKIINSVLEIVPMSSPTAGCLHAIESEVNKQDINLRPWKKRKFTKSVVSSNETVSPPLVVLNSPAPRDPSHVHADSLHKGTLEWSLQHAIDSGQVDLAEKISDFVGDRLVSTTSIDGTIHANSSKQLKCKDKLKARRPVWLFQAKERWEAKSNM
ncbi:hypothetical protein KSF78_0007240 [Schistosoma japonicum]|uniref:SJCHGC08983 protein n=1 Tax=Schistosoma japonicum TaxID=6182 RepID=Q5DDL3_SCHJA|nr:SJCHGC08983 protein [Schistosoma japonicum]KAH8860533.1 hypothetical protein KSF78_0007240 [Schistosoma japonicum]KAH8860534.1 hypothetical protein KSF78_0007240 [Schistosoma japonicum]